MFLLDIINKIILKKELYINSYCKITNHQVNLNGNIIFEDDSQELNTFFKKVYNFLNLKYPKFFKMDALSKVTFLASEFLLKDFERKESEGIAIVFSNNASSLDTDRKHQESINNKEAYYPSPAVFVYTLPNIGIGEVSIRHQLKTENAFFVFDHYNAKFHYTYENNLITSGKATSVLGGWTNVDHDSCDAFVYLVSEKGEIAHNKIELNKLYKK